MTAFCNLPATFYFAYSPIVDFFMRRRTWWLVALVITALISGVAVALSGAASRLQLVAGLLFAGSVAAMLLSAATGGLMASLLDVRGKGKVGAWVQLGNLGANSLLFGFLLFLAPHCTRPVLGVVVAVLILLPGIAVLMVQEPQQSKSDTTYRATMTGIGRELKATFLSLRSLPGILLLGSPIGSGAITTIISGLSHEYGATNEQLGFANGWGGGLFTAAGSLCLLMMPSRWNRLIPYAVSGVIYGGVSVLIACGPLRPSTLIVGLLASNFVQGICFAAYTGVILQTMGMGGRCHSSRYTILNSVGNLPVVYMVAIEGMVAGHFGTRSIGVFDGALNLGTAALFFAWWVWVRERHPRFVELPESVLVEA